MIDIKDTAYPRLKSSYNEKELKNLFKPTEDEIIFCNKNMNSAEFFPCFILLIKSFQCLGYITSLETIPNQVVKYISKQLNLKDFSKKLKNYDNSGSKQRHIEKIRSFFNIKSYYKGGQELLTKVLLETVKSKEDISDIINVCIEYLIKNNYELPSFQTLFKLSKTSKATYYQELYIEINQKLGDSGRRFLDEQLLNKGTSNWNDIKQDFQKPTIKILNLMLLRLNYLKSISKYNYIIELLPNSKMQSLYELANSYDIASMNRVESQKRYALALSIIYKKLALIIDDICNVFIKQMRKAHKKSILELQYFIENNQEKTEAIFRSLVEIEDTVYSEKELLDKFKLIEITIKNNPDICNYARVQIEHGLKNHYRFMWKYFKGKRKAFHKIFNSLNIYSSSDDLSIINAIEFMNFHSSTKIEWIDVNRRYKKNSRKGPTLIDFSWIPDNWWKLVTGKKTRDSFPNKINRKNFEVCLCDQIMNELQSGDLYINGSIEYSDYRKELISEEEAERTRDEYSKIVGIPVEKPEFIYALKKKLLEAASFTDETFKDNSDFKIENGEPKLKRYISNNKKDKNIKRYDDLINMKLEKNIVSLLDIVTDSTKWLNWGKHFGPLSGYVSKLENENLRYAITVFAYGTGLGATQTARAIPEINRRKISFVNIRNISVDRIDGLCKDFINLYNKFDLPKHWGDNSRAAADGTRWDIYENNLLSEYHLRYSQFGGVAYYHVTDTYIALFCHFIPCGVREAIYILDGLTKNMSNINPNILHGDSHAQMLTAFGLSYLLGIKLMPRIKNWKELNFYKPSPEYVYKEIESLFTKESIDWDYIEKHLYDMLRVAQSIKAGKINPSTVLKRLNANSKKNKLYYAFRELGRVVRTVFLLQYLSDEDLRRIIQSATNKCESFNKFVQWVYFGEDIISENDREELLRIIKYNHLLANILIFYNVYSMTKAIKELIDEGNNITHDVVAKLSPYRTSHINRFGTYDIKERAFEEIDYGIKLNI